MQKFKKLLALILALALIASLAACGAEKAPGKNATNETSADGEKAEEPKAQELPFVTVTHHVMGDRPTNGQWDIVQAKWNEKMKEKINAHMEVKWIEWADWYTKYNLILASGEPIDMIHTSSTWLDMWPNAQKGAFLALDELIPKYAPKTWAEIPADHWEQIKYNGKIIGFPENSYTQYVNHGIYYRGDWAKEFGITEPIKDWDTMSKYFQGIKNKKPGVVPWDAAGTLASTYEGFILSKTDAVDVRVGTGFHKIFWAKSYDDKFTIYSPIFEDSFVDYAKTMKEWGDKGYWREDVLNYKGDTRALLRAGKSGADQHHNQTYRFLRTDMEKDQPGSELQMFAWCDTRNNLVGEPITHGATSIGANSKNAKRAVMIYELLRQDEEIYKLVNFGIEGTQYVLKDGKRAQPDGYDETKHGYSSNYWGGRVDKFEIPTTTEYLGNREIWKRYDSFVKPFPYGKFIFDKTPVEAELAALSDVTNQMGPAITFGKAGEPVKMVEEYRAKLKAAGYEKFLAELQKQMNDYKAKFGG